MVRDWALYLVGMGLGSPRFAKRGGDPWPSHERSPAPAAREVGRATYGPATGAPTTEDASDTEAAGLGRRSWPLPGQDTPTPVVNGGRFMLKVMNETLVKGVEVQGGRIRGHLQRTSVLRRRGAGGGRRNYDR